MYKFIIPLLLIGFSFNGKAQESSISSMPISISYWGSNIFHPGMKVGTQYNFKKWDKLKKRKKGMVTKHNTFFLKPELGFFYHKQNHVGALLNADFGIERAKNEKKFYCAYSIGVGYFRQFNSGITYVLEDDNSISEKRFGSRGYFLPTINIEYGQHFEKITWFNKFSLGSKVKYNTGVSVELYFEAGVKFYPFKNK